MDYYKKKDLVDFDQLVEDEGVRTWVRALPNDDCLDKLRPRNGI